MHAAALEAGELFFQLYWQPDYRTILEVGSKDVNGSLRPLAPAGSDYLGIDLEPGRGVDKVLEDPYLYPFPDGSFDCIITTSCFEHDKMFWLSFVECCRVLSPNGVLYVNVPASGPYHGFPYDHWRFYPDAAVALADWAGRMNYGVSVVESFNMPRNRTSFRDCIMVFTKNGDLKPKAFLSDTVGNASNIRKERTNGLLNFDSTFP